MVEKDLASRVGKMETAVALVDAQLTHQDERIDKHKAEQKEINDRLATNIEKLTELCNKIEPQVELNTEYRNKKQNKIAEYSNYFYKTVIVVSTFWILKNIHKIMAIVESFNP